MRRGGRSVPKPRVLKSPAKKRKKQSPPRKQVLSKQAMFRGMGYR